MVSISPSTHGLGSSHPAISQRQNASDVSSTLLSDENSALKRKLEQLGNSNPDISNKKRMTQSIVENTNNNTFSNSVSSSFPKNQNSSLKSEPSLNTFHRTVFQSYVKTALDDLDNKVCVVEYCSRIYKNGGKNGRKKLMRKKEDDNYWI